MSLITKYYGKYRGRVEGRKDPRNKGRLKCTVPKLFGNIILNWANPCVPFIGTKDIKMGSYFIPPVGAYVWVEFEGGNTDYPIWTGGYWLKDRIPEKADEHTDILRTKAGHELVFYNKEDEEKIEIIDSGGQYLLLDASNKLIEFKDANGQRVILSRDNIRIEGSSPIFIDAGGNEVTINSGGSPVNINSGGSAININAGGGPVNIT